MLLKEPGKGPWQVAASPKKFDEAIEAFRKRVPMTDKEFSALSAAAKKKAFRVAGVAQLDLVTDVWRAIDKAVAEGTSFADFKKTVGERVTAAWGGTVDSPGHRLETIFRTNVQTAYSHGRWEQLTDPDTMESHPVWMFDAVLDDRTTDICEECDGTTLPADHGWWGQHNPPLHFSCRSGIIPMTASDADAGMTEKAPRTKADDGFGAPPEDSDWVPSKSDYPSELWDAKEID